MHAFLIYVRVVNELHVCSLSRPVLYDSDSCSQDDNDQIQKPSAVTPINLNSASKEMISDSVELCETEVCFMHIQLIGTNV